MFSSHVYGIGQTYAYEVVDDGTERTACSQLTKCQLVEGTATSVAGGRQAIINPSITTL